jgi:hypothetical protein
MQRPTTAVTAARRRFTAGSLIGASIGDETAWVDGKASNE